PTAGALPRLPRTERHLRRPLLAALRMGRAGDGDLRPGGRAPTVGVASAPALRQDARARARARARIDARRPAERGERVLPLVPHVARARSARARRPRGVAQRALRRTP